MMDNKHIKAFHADESAKLRQERDTLAEQVKRLVRVETRLYDYQEKLDTQLKEYKNLYELSRKLNANFNLQRIFELAVEYVIQDLQYERVLFLLRSENEAAYSVCAHDGYYDPFVKDEIAGLVLRREDPLLVSLMKGSEYVLCGAESEEPTKNAYRSTFQMQEYFIYRFGHQQQPMALLVAGNSAEKAEFYRRVSDRDGSLLGIGNLAGLLSSTIENIAFYEATKRALDEKQQAEQEKSVLQAQLLQSQKMEAIGTLAGGIAHDFNNILTVLLGYSNLILDKMDGNDPRKAYADEIMAASERAADLTRGLLAFSRKQVMELKPHGVNAIVTGMEKLLQRLLSEDIEFKTRLASEDIVINADIVQIGQAVLNLSTNARDAMPKGGTLVIETRREFIDENFIRTHGNGEKGSYAIIAVSDTGSGMDQTTRQKIFEPFFTTKEVGKGTGLGLSIVYGIVKQHKGFIFVVSELGKGTTVQIAFPEVMERETEAVSQTLPEAPTGAETILVAEDNPDLRKLIEKLLVTKGYAVITARDGQDAVEKFKEHKAGISLLLFDVVMPRKNGMDAYYEIQKLRESMRVLFMSGYTGDTVFDKGIQDSSLNFVSKPLSPNLLLKKVREILNE